MNKCKKELAKQKLTIANYRKMVAAFQKGSLAKEDYDDTARTKANQLVSDVSTEDVLLTSVPEVAH